MNLRLAGKLGLIGLLLLLLLVPLGLLEGLVDERQLRALEVAQEIAQSTGGAQHLVGPLLLIEQIRRLQRSETVIEHGQQKQVSRQELRRERRLLLPQTLAGELSLASESRGRGPFRSQLFHAEQRWHGDFVADLAADPDPAVSIDRVSLLLAVSDSRGLRGATVSVGGQALAVEPGSGLHWQPQGLHAELPASVRTAPLRFQISLQISGAETLSWLPTAAESRLQVSGDWPHPSFFGRHLPQAPQIDAQGFRAHWQLSRLAAADASAVGQCSPEADQCAAAALGFGLRLLQPVDHYRLSERALKYALLQLSLVFGVIFLLEALSERALHPIHYGLVGLALAMFFLLLLALAEQLQFALAYLLAALACSALIGHYLGGVLRRSAGGGLLGALLLVLYGVLYVVLRAEDLALLLGACLLFALLAAVMLSTRGFDWNRLGQPPT